MSRTEAHFPLALVDACARIEREVSKWAGVEVHPHRFGGREFRVGRRELGHVHGDALIDIPFPTAIGRQLVVAGEAEAHHVLPASGWVSVRLRGEEDLERGIALLRRAYQSARERRLGLVDGKRE